MREALAAIVDVHHFAFGAQAIVAAGERWAAQVCVGAQAIVRRFKAETFPTT